MKKLMRYICVVCTIYDADAMKLSKDIHVLVSVPEKIDFLNGSGFVEKQIELLNDEGRVVPANLRTARFVQKTKAKIKVSVNSPNNLSLKDNNGEVLPYSVKLKSKGRPDMTLYAGQLSNSIDVEANEELEFEVGANTDDVNNLPFGDYEDELIVTFQPA